MLLGSSLLTLDTGALSAGPLPPSDHIGAGLLTVTRCTQRLSLWIHMVPTCGVRLAFSPTRWGHQANLRRTQTGTPDLCDLLQEPMCRAHPDVPAERLASHHSSGEVQSRCCSATSHRSVFLIHLLSRLHHPSAPARFSYLSYSSSPTFCFMFLSFFYPDQLISSHLMCNVPVFSHWP